MKKILLLILVAAIVFSVAACGGTPNTTEGDTTGTTTPAQSETDSETTDTDTDTDTDTGTNSQTSTETETPDDGEINTEDAENVQFGYIKDGDKTSGLTSRRTGLIEVSFSLDGETYGATLGLEYPLYDWVVDITDSNGTTTRINVGFDFDFVADQATGNIKAYFGLEAAGFVPNVDEDYTVVVYGLDFSECVYFGTAEVTAKVGYDLEGEIIKEVRYLDWNPNTPPYENHHPSLPHEGRVVLVYEVRVQDGDGNMFAVDQILTFFDIFMYVDGAKHQITEISAWSRGLRFGIEAAGFVPTTNGQENEIRFELCEKGTDRVIFEVEKTTIKSNFPMTMKKDPNRAEDDDKKYDAEKITATGPAGFSNQGVEYAFDGKIESKYCVADITSEPVLVTTEDSIKVSSISFVTAEDSARFISSGGRLPAGFKIEGSADGSTWTTLIDIPAAVFEDIENHKEYNFAIETAKQASYSNYRFTFDAASTIQFSEIIFFQA